MSAAEPNERPELVREESILTPAQDKQMQRMDQNGDGVISKKEARAEARYAAEQLAKLSFWKMVALGIVALLFLSWIGNAGLMAVIVALSKDLKVEGSALKNTNGDAISTLGQKQVYEVTLVKAATRRELGEQGSNATMNDTHAHQHSPVVAQVSCANVLLAISSIENGIDGSLVKIDLGSGRVWEPRASAATYEFQDNSFGIEQIYLDDQRDESYDVTCEISKADCESAPESVCDAVSSEVIFQDEDRRALSFEDAFDGDSEANPRRRRRLASCPGFGKAHDDDDDDDDDDEHLHALDAFGNPFDSHYHVYRSTPSSPGTGRRYHSCPGYPDLQENFKADHQAQHEAWEPRGSGVFDQRGSGRVSPSRGSAPPSDDPPRGSGRVWPSRG